VRAWTWETTNNELDTIDGGNMENEVSAVFYADDRVIASTDPVLVQDSTDYLVELFERVGLHSNTSKTKAMASTPMMTGGHVSTHDYKRRMSGVGPSYNAQQKR
jgi:hypothetical protein